MACDILHVHYPVTQSVAQSTLRKNCVTHHREKRFLRRRGSTSYLLPKGQVPGDKCLSFFFFFFFFCQNFVLKPVTFPIPSDCKTGQQHEHTKNYSFLSCRKNMQGIVKCRGGSRPFTPSSSLKQVNEVRYKNCRVTWDS